MEPLNYQTQTPPQAPIATPAPKKLRSHAFLLTLITLMILSLIVWAYFLYCVPQNADNDDTIYSTPVVHHTQPTESTSSIEADLNAAGTVDNSKDLNDIDQAFQ
jgi:hypothetical protein